MDTPSGGGIEKTIKDHPFIIIGGLLVVFLMIYLSRSGGGGGSSVSYAPAQPTSNADAVALQQSADQTFASNIQAVTSLLSLRDQTSAAREVSLAQTSAAKDVELAQTEAAHDVYLNQIASGERTALTQTAAQVTAAQIMAQTNALTIAANSAAEARNAANVNFAIQADKDKKRAELNAGIITNLFTGAEHLIASFF